MHDEAIDNATGKFCRNSSERCAVSPMAHCDSGSLGIHPPETIREKLWGMMALNKLPKCAPTLGPKRTPANSQIATYRQADACRSPTSGQILSGNFVEDDHCENVDHGCDQWIGHNGRVHSRAAKAEWQKSAC